MSDFRLPVPVLLYSYPALRRLIFLLCGFLISENPYPVLHRLTPWYRTASCHAESHPALHRQTPRYRTVSCHTESHPAQADPTIPGSQLPCRILPCAAPAPLCPLCMC